jgi:hypothetical protein
VNRFSAILLAFCYLALGTGGLEYAHNLQHAAEDAKVDAIATAAGAPVEHHQHDETNCDVHAQLHLALFLTSWVPTLICLGLFVAFLTLILTPLIPRLVPVRIDCRGPPRA